MLVPSSSSNEAKPAQAGWRAEKVCGPIFDVAAPIVRGLLLPPLRRALEKLQEGASENKKSNDGRRRWAQSIKDASYTLSPVFSPIF